MTSVCADHLPFRKRSLKRMRGCSSVDARNLWGVSVGEGLSDTCWKTLSVLALHNLQRRLAPQQAYLTWTWLTSLVTKRKSP